MSLQRGLILSKMNSYSITNFTVVFGNPEEVYFAGQEISGKVEYFVMFRVTNKFIQQILIEAKESIKINDILFEIKGRAKANWTSGSNKNFHSNEPYFCEQFALSYVNKLESAHDADNSKVSDYDFCLRYLRYLGLIRQNSSIGK